jgi:hypothetical protein
VADVRFAKGDACVLTTARPIRVTLAVTSRVSRPLQGRTYGLAGIDLVSGKVHALVKDRHRSRLGSGPRRVLDDNRRKRRLGHRVAAATVIVFSAAAALLLFADGDVEVVIEVAPPAMTPRERSSPSAP